MERQKKGDTACGNVKVPTPGEQNVKNYGSKFDAGKVRMDLIWMKGFNWLRGCKCVLGIPRNEREFSELAATATMFVNEGEYDKLVEVALPTIFSYCAMNMGIGSEPLTIEVMNELAKTYTYGANIHGVDNWKGLGFDRVFPAMLRHIKYHCTKDKYDSESGYLHTIHIMWNCISSLYFAIEQDLVDFEI